MLNATEKHIIEKVIEHHKKHGGMLTPDNRYDFRDTLNSKDFEPHIIFGKAVALGLIEYTRKNILGWTSLTEKGWKFTTFEKYEENQNQENEIYEKTIEKLNLDLLTAKRHSKFFYPLTFLTIVLGLITIAKFTLDTQVQVSIKNLELRVDTTSRAVKDLTHKIDSVRVGTSTHVASSTIKK